MENKKLLKQIGNYQIFTFDNPYSKNAKGILIENVKTGSSNYPIVYRDGRLGFDFRPIQKVRAWFNHNNLSKFNLN